MAKAVDNKKQVPKTRVGRLKKKVRGKGRPGKATLTVGKDALIDKACELLQKMPPSQITNAAVAREAGVDPSLIRYYFKTRSALLLATFVRATESYQKFLEEESARCDNTPAGQLCARVSALFRLTNTYPYYHDLIIEEIAEMKDAKARKVLQALTEDRMGMYEAIVARGISEGQFKDIDPRLMFVAIIGMCHFFTKGSNIIKLALNSREIPESLSQDYRKLVCDLLLHGISQTH